MHRADVQIKQAVPLPRYPKASPPHAKERNRTILDVLHAVNELGEAFALLKLHEHSLTNPCNCCPELMVRIAGFEAIAIDRNRGTAAGYIAKYISKTSTGMVWRRISTAVTVRPLPNGSTPGRGPGGYASSSRSVDRR